MNRDYISRPPKGAIRHMTKWALGLLQGVSKGDLLKCGLADCAACTGEKLGTNLGRNNHLCDMDVDAVLEGRRSLPTCPQCLVLWDQALELGKYIPAATLKP